VIHFDSHLDTWKPKVFGGSPSKVASINHGTYFYHASQEGLLANDTNIHAGIRTTLSGPSDYENDGYCGFEIVEAREIDTIGMTGIIKKIKDRVGTTKPVYLSIDIDTLDPACKKDIFLLAHTNTDELQSHLQPVLQRQGVGLHANSALF
jgi:agmatinase